MQASPTASVSIHLHTQPPNLKGPVVSGPMEPLQQSGSSGALQQPAGLKTVCIIKGVASQTDRWMMTQVVAAASFT